MAQLKYANAPHDISIYVKNWCFMRKDLISEKFGMYKVEKIQYLGQSYPFTYAMMTALFIAW